MKTMAERDKNDKNDKIEKSQKGNNIPAWFTEKWESVTEFYTETRHEMQRVTWPTRKQVQGTTIVVICTVFFFGAFFMVADGIVGFLIDALFKRLGKA
jgi:preprotein translocase subunit SecE